VKRKIAASIPSAEVKIIPNPKHPIGSPANNHQLRIQNNRENFILRGFSWLADLWHLHQRIPARWPTFIPSVSWQLTPHNRKIRLKYPYQ
jgi:hypothetical protein